MLRSCGPAPRRTWPEPAICTWPDPATHRTPGERCAGPMTNMMMTTPLRLSGRENGPKGMSNGGFACGTFAGLVGGTARVTLHRKVPLETDLTARITAGTAKVL